MSQSIGTDMTFLNKKEGGLNYSILSLDILYFGKPVLVDNIGFFFYVGNIFNCNSFLKTED